MWMNTDIREEHMKLVIDIEVQADNEVMYEADINEVYGVHETMLVQLIDTDIYAL
jgi:hypothetical protein